MNLNHIVICSLYILIYYFDSDLEAVTIPCAIDLHANYLPDTRLRIAGIIQYGIQIIKILCISNLFSKYFSNIKYIIIIGYNEIDH